ncbi:MAG: hypothetical protein N3B01_02000 [Verrucomicrobiae bacterium]|nr:hypothetical protein [Verrucomicrobiae bacterium]
MKRMLFALLAATAFSMAVAHGQLRFEAEDYSSPRDAWLKDKIAPNRWTLWSTDKDADKKWSGGVVLRSPPVMADRATPDDGAPPLHTVLTDIPNGVYNIRIKCGRVLAVSLDGRNWSRYTGGWLAQRVTITNGTFELWVDDRFAAEKRLARGPAYYDCVFLYPCAPLVNGVPNGGFEVVTNNLPLGWSFSARGRTAKFYLDDDGGCSGKFAARIEAGGETAWTLVCTEPIAVKPGDELAVSARVKGTVQMAAAIEVEGWANGRRVTRLLGRAGIDSGASWNETKGHFTVPEPVTELRLAVTGVGAADICIDDIALRRERFVLPAAPRVQGWAKERVEEKLDRGVVAARIPGGVYVGWRLLKTDPGNVGFEVFRRVGNSEWIKLTEKPITQTSDFVDRHAPAEEALTYMVATTASHIPFPSGTATPLPLAADGTSFVSIKLRHPQTRFSKMAVADLNGDGRYDFVIKQPDKNIDPANWRPSADTYKIEAYLSDGTLLWQHDLGWAIECGVWYSPFIACDLDGDGKAEVAAKIGEGDPRGPDGRVRTGPEWLVVWDGMTGKEIARAAWPDRYGFAEYSRMSRNQMAVAHLDGKTPCLVALRGTYDRMKADAYQLRNGKLELLWRYDNNRLPVAYWGQGEHFTHAADIDGDGRDEVILGCAVLDDNGVPLWSIGLGHNDFAYIGDINPRRPGLEIFYGIETRAVKNGMCLVDAATGKILWGYDQPTVHIHGAGMCADIDPSVPGLECFALDCLSKIPDRRKGPWLWAADGTLLWFEKPLLPRTYSLTTVYWDADLQKELVRNNAIFDYAGGRIQSIAVEGAVAIADVLGDWREEIIASFPGEIRIYTPTIPAADRRVCLMQDPIYRADVRMNSMGYYKPPMTSYCLEAESPGLNLTVMTNDAGNPFCRVVVSAPLREGVTGTVQLAGSDGLKLLPNRFGVDLKPGEREIRFVEMQADSLARPRLIRAALTMKDRVLRVQVPVGHRNRK